MYTLLQHQLCPLSRYVRLMLGEYGLGFSQVVKTNIFYVGGANPHDLNDFTREGVRDGG